MTDRHLPGSLVVYDTDCAYPVYRSDVTQRITGIVVSYELNPPYYASQVTLHVLWSDGSLDRVPYFQVSAPK